RAVLVDLEVVLVEVRDVLRGRVRDGDVERDELDAAANRALRLSLRDKHGRAGRRHEHGDSHPPTGLRDHRAAASPVRVRARATSPGFDTVTSIFSGGISVSGRA